jgi:NAD(P)-dependent dehydrogenase (short-subunit alcohol dehydrogenase family)
MSRRAGKNDNSEPSDQTLAGEKGRIVNISSIAGKIGQPAQHTLLEQALPRAAPKRATNFAIEEALGLKPDPERALKGISI